MPNKSKFLRTPPQAVVGNWQAAGAVSNRGGYRLIQKFRFCPAKPCRPPDRKSSDRLTQPCCLLAVVLAPASKAISRIRTEHQLSQFNEVQFLAER